jgi:hypothetical protein
VFPPSSNVDTDRSNQILVESLEYTIENIPDFPLEPNQETRVCVSF